MRHGTIVLIGMVALITLPLSVFAQPTELHFSLESEAGGKQGIPGNCSTWHELYPAYCASHHQVNYEDDGDGAVSVCDHITLTDPNGLPVRYHITWVGPTYYLDCGTYEPTDPASGGDPYCEIWHQVYPDYCSQHHVDGWEDADSSQTVTPCDFVMIDGTWCHVVDVALDIKVVPDPGSPAEPNAWGRIKSFFSQLF
jgi:hypothetical protein